MPASPPFRLVIPRYGEIPGLPARAFVLSNSERMEMACDRRWFHRYAERLRPTGEARALTYGSGWALVMEDLHRWWMVHDRAYPFEQVIGGGPLDRAPRGSCPWCVGKDDEPDCSACAGTRLSIPFQLRLEWLDAARVAGESEEEARENVETLFRALRGYVEVYGPHPSPEYRVVAVEVMVFAAIVDPETGKPFRPRIPMVEEGDGSLRLAGPGETPTTWRSWPWYQIGKLDVVLQHRRTGALWVEDSKSSRDPVGYLRNVTVDPQTTGYVWMLREAIREGRLPFTGEVVGVQWDVASSSLQHYPQRLVEKELAKKDEKRAQGFTHHPPSYSKATNRTTPSWLYVEAIQQAAPTPDGQRPKLEDYMDHLQWCRENVDLKLYHREPTVAPDEGVEDYRWEMVGVARKLAAALAATVKVDSPERLATLFPRTPLCRKPGGSCPFTSLCAGGDPEDAYREFTTSEGLRWERPAVDSPATSETISDPSLEF